MGILDDVLRPHLEAVTRTFKQNEVAWLIEAKRPDEPSADGDNKAKIFLDQGNALLYANHLTHALRMYTCSIAAALKGPLASQAYFYRYIVHLIKKNSYMSATIAFCCLLFTERYSSSENNENEFI